MRKLAVLLTVVALVATLSLGATAATYTLGLFEEPTTLNPFGALGPDATTWNFVVATGIYYPGLYGSAMPKYQFSPSLASDMPGEFVEEEIEGTTYFTSVIPLRQDQTWNTGDPVNADDVVFTYDTIQEFALTGNWATYNNPDVLARVEKVDDYAVKFVLKKYPGLAEWQYGVLQSLIVSKNAWEDRVAEAWQVYEDKVAEGTEEVAARELAAKELYGTPNPNPVTALGIQFSKWEKGAYWANTAREDYQGDTTTLFANDDLKIENPSGYVFEMGACDGDTDYVVEEGPFFDDFIYRLYLNQQAALIAVQRGEVDFLFSAQGLVQGYKEQLEGDPNIGILANPSNGFRFLAFNQARYPFGIPEFGEAVATLIDRDFVLNNVLQGAAIPLATPIPPGNAYWYKDDVEIPGTKLDEEGNRVDMTRSERVAYATEVLKSAGFTWEVEPEVDVVEDLVTTPGQGLKMPNFEPFEPFVMMTPPAGYDPMRATFGLYIQLWLQDVGIPIISRPTSFNTISQKVFDEVDFDAFILGWGLGGIYPDYMRAFFHTDGGFQVVGASDAEYDEYIDNFMAARTMEEAKYWMDKAQDRFQKFQPYTILFTTEIYDVYRKDRIEYPYTEVLDGIQGVYGVPSSAKPVMVAE